MFQRLTKLHAPVGRVLKFTSANLFQIAREKSYDYVLIMYMKKYEVAYHNYAEEKRAHRV